MKQKRLILVMALLCLFSKVLQAQDPCAFDSVQAHITSQNERAKQALLGHQNNIVNYRNRPSLIKHAYHPNPLAPAGNGCNYTRYLIPVVVHIDTTFGVITMSDAQVQNQLDAVNLAMKDYGIQVCLAHKRPDGSSFTGINRIGGSNLDNRLYRQDTSFANTVHYDPSRYLNIYVVRTILKPDSSASTFQGYSNKMPGQGHVQGIFMRYTRFGDYNTCSGCTGLDANSRGKVLVHELGHYLGLWHTFEGGCSAGNNATNCGNAGDYCCDTRPVSSQNTACPLPTPSLSCSYHLSIPENRSNYMEYGEEDCWDNFSPDQVDIMYTVLETSRVLLVNAGSVDSLQTSCCINIASFSSNTTFMCAAELDTFRLIAISTDSGSTYTWTIKDSTHNVVLLDTTLTVNTFNMLLTDTAWFNITLRVINSYGDTMYLTRNHYMQIADCGISLQNPQANWYFGYYAGLKFTENGVFRDDKPSLRKLPHNIYTPEGSVSISNATGQMLFYASGRYDANLSYAEHLDIYNRYYRSFQTGPVKGDWSSVQTAVAFPVPHHAGKYYLFTASCDDARDFNTIDNRGLRYSVIDTSVIGNLQYGEVDSTRRDVPVRAPSGSAENPTDSSMLCGEMICAIPKCNNKDFWLIVTDNSPIGYANRRKIIIYNVDSSGATHHTTTSYTPSLGQFGYIKSSPDGTKVAVPGLIFDFNRVTGSLTLLDSTISPYVQSMSFSPDSKLLYYLSGLSNNASIYQYSFDDSTTRFITNHSSNYNNAMQIAPNGKIYIARAGENQISVINNPNAKARFNGDSLVGYSVNGPILEAGGIGGVSGQGLPNMVDAKYPEDIPKMIVYEAANCFTFKFTQTLCCAENFKWYFGDGDSATGKTVVHTFDSLKSYVVMLVTESDTITDTVRVGIDAPQIAGIAGAICDTLNRTYEYSIGNKNQTYQYSWQISSPNDLFVDNNGNANVDWEQTNSWLKLVATSQSGCKDSSLITVELGPGIYANTILADTNDCDDIIGSTPWGLWTYAYSWQRSFDSTNWTNIPSQTGKDLTAPVYFRTTYVRRVVQDSVCTSYSNVLTMQPSVTTTITAAEDTICPGNELDVTGSTPCSQSYSITYRWQSLLAGDTEFVDLGGYGVYANLYNQNWSTECYLRRRSISAGDTLYSDTVFIASRELINMIFPLSSEPYLYRFCHGEDVPELDGSQPCNQQSIWAYQWQSCTDTTNNSWSNISVDAVGNNYNPPSLYQTTYYRRKAVNTSTSEVSYTPVFTMRMRNPQITQQPVPVHVNEGSNATFTIQVTDMEIMHWQESYVNSGITFYNDIQDSNLDTLLVRADACKQGKHYRAVVQNMCTLADVYSDSATLTVTTFNYNLWSKDYDTDYSAEPSTGFIWNSPDIWNRRSNDAGTAHQNPEHRTSAPNYVYVKVRNLGGAGQVGSIPAKVYLYWTFANTGEKWSKHWLHNFDADSLSGNWRTYLGNKHALGGLIDILEINSLNAGAETTLYVPWYPPNPGVINGGTDTVNADVCFLSRIVTCENEPFGMSHHEISDIGFNVRYNNNIITKNFVVYDTLQGNGKVRWAGNGNPRDDARTGRLVFQALHCDFLNYGEVYLHLNQDLQEAWYANGALGSGFTVVNDSTLRMDTCEVVLENIIYSVEQQAWMGVQFNEREDVTITEVVDEVFMFSLQEYLEEEDQDTSIGGIIYGVPVVLYPPGIGALQRRNEGTENNSPLASAITFNAYPNPFNRELNIAYSLPEDKLVSITVTNLLGQTVLVLENNSMKPSGKHSQTLQSSAWREGIYFITFKAGDKIIQKKIVLIR